MPDAVLGGPSIPMMKDAAMVFRFLFGTFLQKYHSSNIKRTPMVYLPALKESFTCVQKRKKEKEKEKTSHTRGMAAMVFFFF